MARARNIKPSFFKNENLAELPFSTRLLFIGLWMLADREGRLEDRPKRIKMEVFPGDDCNVEKGLTELHASGFIHRYDIDGHRYIEVCAFLKHQNPHFREPPSTIPKPEANPQLQLGLSPSLDEYSKHTKPEADGTLNVPEARGQPEAGPSLARLNPESPFLNPESREKAMSGKPDAKPLNGHVVEVEILAYLNEKAGRSYRPVKSNIRLIAARLKEGATPDEIRAVVDRKCAQWIGDGKMEQYLRPETLFGATKFAQYQGELSGTNHPVLDQLRRQHGASIQLTPDGRAYTDGSRYWRLDGEPRVAL